MNVSKDIREFFLTKKLMSSTDTLEDSESLLEKGVIDSVIIQEVIAFVEKKYGIVVDDDDMIPENFDSFSAIENYVNDKQNAV